MGLRDRERGLRTRCGATGSLRWTARTATRRPWWRKTSKDSIHCKWSDLTSGHLFHARDLDAKGVFLLQSWSFFRVEQCSFCAQRDLNVQKTWICKHRCSAVVQRFSYVTIKYRGYHLSAVNFIARNVNRQVQPCHSFCIHTNHCATDFSLFGGADSLTEGKRSPRRTFAVGETDASAHGRPPQDPADFLWLMTEEPHRTRRMAIMKAHPDVRCLFFYQATVAHARSRSRNSWATSR